MANLVNGQLEMGPTNELPKRCFVFFHLGVLMQKAYTFWERPRLFCNRAILEFV